MNQLIREQTSRSLCLIDEFGKGTAPTDGMSLLASCIKFFSQLGTKVFFILHFTEIFKVLDISLYPNIEAFKMVVHKEENSNDETDEFMTPLFKLQLGISDSSGGINCAKMAGVKEEVLFRAEVIYRCLVESVAVPFRRTKKQYAVDGISNLLVLKHFFSPTTDEACSWTDASAEQTELMR